MCMELSGQGHGLQVLQVKPLHNLLLVQDNSRSTKIVNLQPDEPFVYEEPDLDFMGPLPPNFEVVFFICIQGIFL